HQIARVSDHRQCPGGREERGRSAQANRLWPDRCRACGGVSEVFHGLLEPVSELPSSVRLCHYRDQLAGEAQANLPPQGLSNALRETHHLKGMDRIPEGGNYGWDAETSVRSSQRHRGCAADAKSKAQLIGALPDNTMRQERYGNAGAVESVESQKQAYHSFHEPLGNLANGGGDSAIPTAPTTRAMEKWKTKSRFPTFPPPRGYIGKTNEKPRRAGFAPRPPKTTVHQRKETCPGNLDVAIFRLTPPWKRTALSCSRRIGINSRFQAHLWIG